MEKFILIDGNSLLNRAYYATPAFTTKDGFPTNGIFGFIKLLLKIASDKKPEYMAVAFDVHAPTFRHKMYDGYKAGRKPMPEDLVKQLPVLKETLSLMNIKICELKGYEADDIIGTLSKRFNVQTYIYTGDRDSYQLVDEATSVCFTRKGVTDILELRSDNFTDEVGLVPKQIIDLKSLMGDSSDNIPGVNGVGEKSAHALLERYGSLDNIYAHIDEIGGALHRKLVDGKETAYFSYKLAAIDTDVPIDVSLSDCVFRMPFSLDVRRKFVELDFKILSSMQIFENENAQSNDASSAREKETDEEIHVTKIQPKSLAEGLSAYESVVADALEIACDLSGNSFGFCVKTSERTPREYTEYEFPIKRDLLDVGYFQSDLKPLFDRIFSGSTRLIVYNYKDLRRRLTETETSFTAPYHDVALIKYIAEGLGVAESLDYALDFHGLSTAKPAYGVYRLFEIYGGALNDREQKLYNEVELPLSEILYDMEEEGVCVDEKIIDELSAKYNAELKDLTEKIYEQAGEAFNINSPVKLGNILFEKLKIGNGTAQKSKGKRNYGTSAEILEQYADEHEIIRLLLRYRQIQKLNSTYIDGFKPLIKNGKIHTTYNQINTSTGRLSSANPNLQNIPVRTDEGRELRKIFKASEGNVLLDADYSQIELRLLAHFSGCKELVQAYRENKDIHATTAALVFDAPIEKVTPNMRREAKAVNFGIIYGISPFGLAKDLNISAKKATAYIDKYFETYSDVKEYMDRNVDFAKTNGYVTTLFGRRRVINELKSSNYNLRSFGERAAMNMPLQGSSADIIKIAMLNVYRKLKEGGFKAKLVLQVHDELIIDCPISEQEAVAHILKTEMEHAVELNVPLEADVGCGDNWFDAH